MKSYLSLVPDLCKGAETAESDDHSVCHYFDISGDSNF